MARSRRTLLATLATAGLAGCNTPDGSSTELTTDDSTVSGTGETTETGPSTTDTRTLSGDSRLRYFGGSVAASGSTAVVGADTIGGIVATVLTRAGGSWSRVTKFTPANVEASFGRVPVAAADGTLLVGPVAYAQTDGGWRRQRLSPEGEQVTQSPQSVALGDDTAVVGAGDNETVSRFTRTGDGWTHDTTLTHPDGADDTGFGRVVAADGDRLVVGAPRADELHVFDGDAHNTTLTADRSLATSLAVSGDRLLIGTQSEDTTGVSAGGALVFEQTGGGWRRATRLTPTGGSTDSEASTDSTDRDGEWTGNYGGELALSGDTAVVSGAWSETPQRQNGVESVAVFTREPDGWRRRTIRSPATTAGGILGPVALAPDSILVGAPMQRDGGVVYVMDR